MQDLLGDSYFGIASKPSEYKLSKAGLSSWISFLLESFQRGDQEASTCKEMVLYESGFSNSIVVYKFGDTKLIGDGQQRLTTLMLLLIYLNNLQKRAKKQVSIESLIFDYDSDTFKISIPEHNSCMEALFSQEPFDFEGKSESVRNLYARYNDLDELFSDQLTEEQLPLFINWLIKKAQVVEITKYKRRVEVPSKLKSKLMDIVNDKLSLLDIYEFYDRQMKVNENLDRFSNYYLNFDIAGYDYWFLNGEFSERACSVLARDAWCYCGIWSERPYDPMVHGFHGSSYDELMLLPDWTFHEEKTKCYITKLARLSAELNECLLNFMGWCDKSPKEKIANTTSKRRDSVSPTLRKRLLDIVDGNLTLVNDGIFFDRQSVIIEMNRLIEFCDKKEDQPDWWYEKPCIGFPFSSYDELMYLSCPEGWMHDRPDLSCYNTAESSWDYRKAEDIYVIPHLATEINECLLLHAKEVIELDRKLHYLINE